MQDRDRDSTDRARCNGKGPIKVRIHAPWVGDDEVFETWRRYMKPGDRWNDLLLVRDEEPDWWIVFNFPRPGFVPEPTRTLLYQHEPGWLRSFFPSPWNDPPADLVAGCYTIERYQMPFHWAGTFRKTWDELADCSPQKMKQLSAVISGKSHSSLAKERRNFIINHADSIPGFEVFGAWNEPPCACYRGCLHDKSDGLLPYRYTLAIENCHERNYFTEKITDAIVSETLAFYSGCPNLADFIDPECFIPVDLADGRGAAEIIVRAIQADEWHRRLPAIRREKWKILHERLFFAEVERHIGSLTSGSDPSVDPSPKPDHSSRPYLAACGEPDRRFFSRTPQPGSPPWNEANLPLGGCQPGTSSVLCCAPPSESRILVGICSARSYSDRRSAVRETWLSCPAEGITCRFFVGRGKIIADEPDTIVLDVDDGYDELPAKVRAFFVWALEHADFDWLFKCDDDTYVALERLGSLVRSGHDLIADETQDIHGTPSGGAGYFLSRRMVALLVADESLPSKGPEDVIFGRAAVRHGASVLVTKRLFGLPNKFPRRDNDLVTSHRCSPERLRVVHSLFQGRVQTVWLTHPCWRDLADLGSDGRFARRESGCGGFWKFGMAGNLVLDWTDWDEETFLPAAVSASGHGDRVRMWTPEDEIRVTEVVVILMGGLGNQMFQYAHGLALARRIGARLKLRFADWGRPFALDMFGISLDPNETGESSDFYSYEGGYTEGAEWLTFKAACGARTRTLTISGYFQNERFFLPVADELRETFRLPLRFPTEAGGRAPVCVHVRRGDFVGSRHDICRPAYFRSAMARMRMHMGSCQFLIISDDPEWCRDEFKDLPDVAVAPVQSHCEALGTMCASKGLILSNSTFGWWGAWMAGDVPVIAPDRFLAGATWNICPERWTLLSAEGTGE